MQIRPPSQSYQLARQFRKEQLTPQKGKSVNLNILAVHSVERYLRIQGISSEPAQSHSHDPILMDLEDTADLVIPNIGRVECRPVLHGESNMKIPGSRAEDLVGYVVVQFEESLDTVDLLGFVPAHTIPLEQAEISLLNSPSYFLPIEEIFIYLDPITRLERIFQGILTGIWKKLSNFSQDLAERLQTELASPSLSLQVRSRTPEEPLLSDDAIAKPIPIGSDLALVIDRLPQANAPEGEEIAMCIIVCSVDRQRTLPAGIQMTVSDGQNSGTVSQIPGAPIMIQRFTGKPGEAFQISIMCDGAEYSESLNI